MGIAFRTDTASVEVAAQQQLEQNFVVGAVEITCGFIEGMVTCPDEQPVVNAIVKAVNTATGNVFFGITNDDGFYAICVSPGMYNLFVYCCPEGCCQDAPCPTCC